MAQERGADGTTSVEPLGQQVVPHGKGSLVATSTRVPSFASPSELGSGAASVVGASLEAAMDRMLKEYTAQHQSVKSLVQVHIRRLSSVHLLPQPPSVQSTSRLRVSAGDLSFLEEVLLSMAHPLALQSLGDFTVRSLYRSRREPSAQRTTN